ncbi:MAG: hypothetical protein AAB393_14420, partial [Bacteroidota bacterium]
MKKFVLVLMAVLLLPATHFSQDQESNIEKYLARVEKGEADAVRAELPSLLMKYPNNPGVLYLQGVLTINGTEAVRTYQSIVDNFPRSDWADDALHKVYQFYYAIGLYRTAEIKLNQLKTDYPQSKYVSAAGPVDTKDLAEEKQPVETPRTESDQSRQNDSTPTDAKKPVAEITSPPTQHAPEEPARGQYTLQVGAFSQ